MTSDIQAADGIERAYHQQPSSRRTLFDRFFGGGKGQAHRQRIIDRLLLVAFGSISPAYLFGSIPKENRAPRRPIKR